MGRVVRVTGPEEAVRLFEAGMLYWHFTPSNEMLLIKTWRANEVRREVRDNLGHHLSYIVEDDSED